MAISKILILFADKLVLTIIKPIQKQRPVTVVLKIVENVLIK